MSQQKQTPVKVFHGGSGVRVAVWENEVQQEGQTIILESFTPQRRYKDKNGQWQTATSYSRDEALWLAVTLFKAVLSDEKTDQHGDTEFPPDAE